MTQKKENKIINDKKKAKNTVKAKQSTKKSTKSSDTTDNNIFKTNFRSIIYWICLSLILLSAIYIFLSIIFYFFME